MTMRRNFRLAAALAAMAVAATAAVPAQAEGELCLYNWSNYYPPDLMKKFEEETGIKVTLDNFASESDMLAKLQAGGGGYDVVFPTHRRVKIMMEQGLAAKLDAPSLSNWKHVAEPFRSTSVDPKREYSAPYMWGTTGFTYDSARVPGGKLEDRVIKTGRLLDDDRVEVLDGLESGAQVVRQVNDRLVPGQAVKVL